MAEFPALNLWTDSYFADTRHLSTVEHGAYLLLLMEAWRRPRCNLPDDDAVLARLAGLSETQWVEIKPVVMAFWKRDGRSKTWSQKRLLLERGKARKRSKSAKGSAEKRWNKKKKADANALRRQCEADASTVTDSKKKNTKKKVEIDKPDGVSDQTWSDFIRHRQAKRAPLTDTALKAIVTEAQKAGWELEAALTEMMARGWQGFKADWVVNSQQRFGQPSPGGPGSYLDHVLQQQREG